MPDSTAPSAFPQVSGRYEIVEELGRGGMGVVYKAYDSTTKRDVAVKTMWGDVEAGAIELFDREWSILARLSHPNIVDILDTGELHQNGQRTPYFVMPLLPGKTLDQIIKTESQRLTVDRVVEIMCQVCKGLQAAHDKKLVHRDLKPSNIFVMDDDTAKIIDFGVAHLADARSVTGVKGTLQYMAPEQAFMSSPVTGKSDLFALAVVCYEALTGRKPFARRTEAETFEALRDHIPPPASEINPSVNNLLSRTIHKAMAKQPWHRFASAREFAETLQKALRNEPIERFDPAKIQPRIERIKKAYDEGDNQFALEILTELESEGHIDPSMPVLRIQIEQAVRQRHIRQLLDNARTRMQSEEHPLALQKLSEVLAIDPANSDALTMRTDIERLRNEKQTAGWFRLADEHRANNLFSQARQALQEVLKIDGGNAKAREALKEIEQTEQELSKIRQEKQRLFEGAKASYQSGEISSALSKLERGLDLNRNSKIAAATTELDAQYQSFYNQVRSERDTERNALAEGRKCLEDKKPERALQICEEYLQKRPSDPMFQALKLEAEECQRQERSAAIAEINRRADAEPDLEKKYNLIKEASERFPDEPHFKSSLKANRERRELVNTIVTRARQFEDNGQFAEAANEWDNLRTLYPFYPGLDYELESLKRKREDHWRAEAKAKWMEQIDFHFAAGEYAQAAGVIKEALAEFPNDKELEGLASLADQGIRRSGEANLLLAEARQLWDSAKHAEALDALRRAERLDPRNGNIRATLLSRIVERSRELISKDWRAAEPLIQEASALTPDDPVVRSLQSLLESQKRQETINTILVEARSLQAESNLGGALTKVEQGLAAYPNEVRLAQLQNTLRSAAAAETAPVNAPPAKPPAPPLPLPVAPKPDPEPAAVRQPAKPSGPQAVPPKPLVAEMPQAQKTAPPRATPPAPIAGNKGSGPKKPMWLMALAAGAVLIVGAGLYPLLHKKPDVEAVAPAGAAVKVNLSANEPGAIFKVDGAVVNAASTSLKPGEHSGEASLDGYAPDLHSFVVPANARGPVNVVFTLRASLPELYVNSAIAAGTVIFDDASAADLQEGSFTRSEIPMGEHKVRIMDGAHEAFSFSFNAAPKQIIKVTGLTAHGASGVVLSSLSGAIQLYATPGLKGAVSGQALQPIPPEGLTIPASNPPQKVTVSDGRSGLRELSPDNSSLPVLRVQLSGAQERIPVTITSNAPDGAGIIINGRPLPRKLAGGTRTFSLGIGTFDILVSADGYQSATPQHLVLKSGDQPQHLDFQLMPVLHMATLSLSGAPPEALVFLGDLRVGTVNANGTFSKDVPPGTAVVSVRKAGMEEFKQGHDFKAGETVRMAVQMKVAAGGLSLHVSPANAKITVSHGSEISTPLNGQNTAFSPGSYVVTAAAEKFQTKTETITIEAGKPVVIDWALTPANDAVPVREIPFSNPASWSKQDGWLVHAGGVTLYEGAPGSHVFDVLKRRGVFKPRRTVMVADFKGQGNYTQYSFDNGKTLYKVVFTGGKPGPEEKLPFASDAPDVATRVAVELLPDSFTIKNKAGTVIDSVKKSDIGRFGFTGDVTMSINR